MDNIEILNMEKSSTLFDTFKNVNYGNMIPDFTKVYDNGIVDAVKNVNYSNMIPNFTKVYDNGIVYAVKNANYSDMIPNITKVYDNGVTNGFYDVVKNIVASNYNPLLIPITLMQIILNFIVFHMCKISLLLMVSLWISALIMKFIFRSPISFYNLTFAIFLNLSFLIYYPCYCI